MAGGTVVTLAFYNTADDQSYYFQFAADGLELPAAPVGEEMADYELANFGAQPFEGVRADILSLDIVAEGETTIEAPADLEIPSSAALTDSEEIPEIPPEDTEPFRPEPSEESRLFDQLIEECRNGPVSMAPATRAIIPDIPDFLYSHQIPGWSHDRYGYREEGANASRDTGYYIYHMPDPYNGNVMNYVMRYECVLNYNFSSQRFIHTFLITHNLWIQFNRYENRAYIFDDRSWNARINVDATSIIDTRSDNGYYTHFQTATRRHGSWVNKIFRIFMGFVPWLGGIMGPLEEIAGGVLLQTGTLHATDKYAQVLMAAMNDMKYPSDQVTIEGIGTGVRDVGCGYTVGLILE